MSGLDTDYNTIQIARYKYSSSDRRHCTQKKKSPFEIKSYCACALHLPTPCPLVALVTEKEGAHGQREGEVPGLLFT